MEAAYRWLEASFKAIPLPVLETWGRCSYYLGCALAILAFGKFTLLFGRRWGLGRFRQSWNVQAYFSIALTFFIIIGTGYLGSFIVLVPGAQTFESAKDLGV